MPEQFLHRTQVSPALKHVGG
ncbi:MAG: hypothetical protein QG597_891, partial [Actinomycetota bacterium]|nr:hypothetical protein [Actinomycetota bacterium]